MKQITDQNGINERVVQLIQHFKFSPTMFARKAEIDNGNFSKKLNKKLPWTIFDIEKNMRQVQCVEEMAFGRYR